MRSLIDIQREKKEKKEKKERKETERPGVLAFLD
jgi:hypothetical protein